MLENSAGSVELQIFASIISNPSVAIDETGICEAILYIGMATNRLCNVFTVEIGSAMADAVSILAVNVLVSIKPLSAITCMSSTVAVRSLSFASASKDMREAIPRVRESLSFSA